MSVWAMLLVLVAACKEGDGGEGPFCSQISDACHEADENGVEGAAECHDIAHEANEGACEKALENCEKTCAPD